ncbi:MAG: AraC family transcriptional regulator [bacterium]
MRINKTESASFSPETSEIHSLIMNEFAQWHANDGALETAIPGVILYRYSAPTEPASLFFEPRISVTLQGKKRVVLGEEEYVYGASQFILTAVDAPVVAQVVEPEFCMAYDATSACD